MDPVTLAILGGIAWFGLRAGSASSGAGSSSTTGGETAPPEDALCKALDPKLKRASERQWAVLKRMSRNYPEYWPPDWRCRTGGTSPGMERVWRQGVELMLNDAQRWDPIAIKALLEANGEAFQALGQKWKEKLEEAAKAVGVKADVSEGAAKAESWVKGRLGL